MKIGAKQISLLALAVVLLVVGYNHEALSSLWKRDTTITDATPTPTGSGAGNGGSQGDGAANGGDDGDAQDTFVHSSLPFAANRLDRDSARAKAKESYEAIAAQDAASDQTRQAAVDKILELTRQAEQETKIESLIREKGFQDAFVSFSDLGEIDVLVKADSLNETQVTQIADIIVRYTDLDYSAIHVRRVA